MKVRTKLSIAITVIYILVGFLGYFSYLNLRNVEIPLRTDVPESLAESTRISELQQIALSLRYYDESDAHSLSRYAYTGDPYWLERHETVHEKFDTAINLIFDYAHAEDVQFINDLKNPIKRLDNMEAGVITAAQAGRYEDSISIIQSTAYNNLRDEIQDQLRTYAKSKDSNLADGNSQPNEAISSVTESLRIAVNRFSTVDISLVVIILAILIVIRVIILNSILKPVEELTGVTKEISKGHLNIKMEPKLLNSQDEVGELAIAVNHMSKNLEDLYKNLEDKVAEKTKQLETSLKEAEQRNLELSNTKKAMLNILEDIQQEKNRFKNQVLETRKFQQAVQVATDGIVITSPEAEILYVNTAWEKLTGYKSAEVLGQNTRILKSGKTDPAVYKEMWNKLTKGKQFITEDVINKRKDGTIYQAQLGIVPVVEGGKTLYYVGIEQDITKRKEVDRMKTEFISLASHQLRTPLSAMKWFLEMLLDESKDKLDRQHLEMLKNIDASNERMIDLVNGLLNVSRIESGRILVSPEPTDLKNIVDTVLKDLALKIKEKGHKIEVDIDKKLPAVELDPKLIRHVYLNIINNSVKYSPRNSKIEVKIEMSEDRVITSVKDNGYGIPAEEQHRIFGKFYRGENILKMDTDGSGLGLYLTKTIVESSGGDIWFESKEDKGTTFWFSFPLKGMKSKAGEVTIDA